MIEPKIFLRKDRLNSNGTQTVYLRVYIKRKKAEFSLKVSVLPEYWKIGKRKITHGDPLSHRKNYSIERSYNKAVKILDDLKFNHPDKYNVEEFKKQFKNKLYGNTDFYKFVEKEIKTKVYSNETKRTYYSQLTKLKKFKSTLKFSELSISFIQAYKAYMIEKLGNGVNTYNKSLGMLKTFTNWALNKDIIKENPFKKIKISRKPGRRDFLTYPEVQKLEELYFSNKLNTNVQNTLRVFLFTCYTGLRYQDMRNLQFKDFYRQNFDGKDVDVIKIDMHKTGLPVSIPVIDRARRFLPDKVSKFQKVFNIYTNQTVNKHLKLIAKMVDLKKHLTFHVARYTVGSVFLEHEITIETISDILGHTDIRITKRLYAKTDDRMRYEQMKKVDLT